MAKVVLGCDNIVFSSQTSSLQPPTPAAMNRIDKSAQNATLRQLHDFRTDIKRYIHGKKEIFGL